MWRLAFLGLLGLIAACGPSQGPGVALQPTPNVEATVAARVSATVAAQPKPSASPAVATQVPASQRNPISVEGALDAQTAPFRLEAGNYTVTWKVTPRPLDGGCVGRLTLKSPDQPTFEQSIVSAVDAKNNSSGTTQTYSVKAGAYYVASGLNCPGWAVTFIPA